MPSFGTDGVRGRANTDVTADFAVRLGRAAAHVLTDPARPRSVVLGGDTRRSTPMLSHALAAGFASGGVDVVDLGVAPTPQVAYAAQRADALGAVVSASHNPFQDNGIKLFGHGGTKLNDAVEAEIERELADPASLEGTQAESVGSIRSGDAAIAGDYVRHLVGILEGRRLDGVRLVLDTAHGAGSYVGPDALRATGAEVVVVNAEPDGLNINEGVGATSPATVAAAVRKHGADLGVALDGDADRLIAVDHEGSVVDGDHIIAICAKDLHRRGALRNGSVVVTVMTNLGFRLAMEDAGIEVVETAVGDRYVLEAMAAGDHCLGGEQSGHVIFSDHATTGDGLLTAIALLDVVRRSQSTLQELAAAAMTSLPQVLVNVPVRNRVPDVAEQLAEAVDEVERELAGAGRVLLRASGTEPLVRVMVEAATEEQATVVADRLADVARARWGT